MDGESQRLVAVLTDSSSDDDAREDAARTLGRRKETGAIDALGAIACGTHSQSVRGAALIALGRIGSAAAMPHLVALWRRDDDDTEGPMQMGAFDAVTQIGTDAVPALVEALGDAAWNARYYAVKSLAALGVPEAAEHIEPLVDDDNELVGALAKHALETLRSGS